MYTRYLGWSEAEDTVVNVDTDLAAGPATPLVLRVLAQGDNYGFAIIKRVREDAGSEVAWTDAMVYPLFHRLRRLGYVTSEWRTSPEGGRRRYYALTDAGRAVLTAPDCHRLDAFRALGGTWWGTGSLLATAA